ncbi:hypothetical protein GCM10023197_39530 [Gordonia humi]
MRGTVPDRTVADGYPRFMPTTRRTDASVEDFIAAVPNARRRDDTVAAVRLIRDTIGEDPSMWGPSIIGFGDRPYRTADGREHEWFAVGLSPRRQALTLYGLTADGSNGDLLDGLGPHTTGKGCLYIARLADVDASVLTELIARAWTS